MALYLLGVYASYYSLPGGSVYTLVQVRVNHVSLFLLMTAYDIYIFEKNISFY
jgi:hypothetical protein